MALRDYLPNIFRQRNRFLEDNKRPNFYNYEVGQTNPVYLNLDDLGKVYNQLPHLKFVINNIGEMVSNGIWKLHKGEIEVENHEVLKLLNNPNPMQSGKDFLFQMYIYEAIYGNGFIYENKVYKDVPSNLYFLNSKNVKIELTGKFFNQKNIEDIIKCYEFDSGDIEEKFEPNEVIHYKGNDDKFIIGESNINTLKQQLSNLYSAYESRNVLITQRGGIGIISAENNKGDLIPMTPQEKKEAEKKWEKNYGVGKDQRKTVFSSTPIKYTPTNFPTSDLMLFEEIKDVLNAICDMYGYNSNLLSRDDSPTYENAKEFEKQVYQNTVIPKANQYADMFAQRYGLKEQGYILSLDYSHLPTFKEDEAIKANIIRTKVEALNTLISIPDENNSKDLKEIKEILLNLLKS